MVVEPPTQLLYSSASNHAVSSMIRCGCDQPKQQLLSEDFTRKEGAPCHGT